jgi:hypothetical protein
MLVGILLLMLVVMIGGLALHFKLSEPEYKIAKEELKRAKEMKRRDEMRRFMRNREQAFMPIADLGPALPIQPLRAGHLGGAEAAFFAQAEADRKLQEAIRGSGPNSVDKILNFLSGVLPFIAGYLDGTKETPPAPPEAPAKKPEHPDVKIHDAANGDCIVEIGGALKEEIEAYAKREGVDPETLVGELLGDATRHAATGAGLVAIAEAREEILSHPKIKE